MVKPATPTEKLTPGANLAKLTPAQRDDVAFLYLSGAHATSDIGRAYGVDSGTVLRHAQRRGPLLPEGYTLSAPMPEIPALPARTRRSTSDAVRGDGFNHLRGGAASRSAARKTYAQRAAERRSIP